jgi:hypothetical protein
MKDFYNFLRFTLPGLSFVVFIIATLFFTDYKFIVDYYKQSSSKDFVNLIGLFVVSGGAGYIFSNIYFSIYWLFPSLFLINHAKVFNNLTDKITIVDINNVKLIKPITKSNAWYITCRFWNEYIIKDVKAPFHVESEHYVDLKHSIGTSLISSIFSFSFWIYIHFILLQNGHSWCFGVTFYVIAILINLFNYLKTNRNHEKFVNGIMTKFIIDRYTEKGVPLIFVFDEKI